ncbi:LysR substrate-binding domain-containing protein [Asanoa sp. NPDC049518]|uniref:LysR family transcriptional regulator n=1 Tax=unclassified Asanoa TaxID=2685164 RepID=UPI003434011F
MELRQLAYFLAVVDEGGFTRGAQSLRVAQPAVSQQIRRLERELGEPVFHRGTRAVSLTAAGEALLPHARAALATVEHAKAAVGALSELLTGTLTIGFVQAQPDERIAALLGDFHRQHPRVRIAALADDPGALFAAVATSQVDIAFVGLAETPPPGVTVELVASEPLVVLAAADHPLAERTDVAVADLREHALASLVQGSGLRAVLERECAAAGFTPRIVAETTDLTMLADLVAAGVGAAVLPAGVAAARDTAVTIALSPPVERRIAMAWSTSTHLSPAGRAFLALARTREPTVRLRSNSLSGHAEGPPSC